MFAAEVVVLNAERRYLSRLVVDQYDKFVDPLGLQKFDLALKQRDTVHVDERLRAAVQPSE